MESSYKIIIITYFNFPFGGPSANFIRNLATGLAINGESVEVIMPTGNIFGKKIENTTPRSGTINGVPFKHLGYTDHPNNYFGKLIDNFLGLFLPIFYFIKKYFRKEVDIIIVYNTEFLKTLLFVLLKLILRKKLVIILPEFYEKPKGKLFSLALLKWYNFFIGINYVVKYADSFIILSTYLKDFISKRIKGSKLFFLIPNLTQPEIFKLKNVKPYIENKITIGYTGRPTRKDGVLDLITSFGILHKKYPNTHLLIIGDITNGKTIIPDLIKHANSIGVCNQITFTGLVSYSEIPRLLNSCQILALTRPKGVFAEAGFPTKLGEYFACRKPVVLSKVGDIPKYFIDEEQVILVEPENIDSIVDGFERIILNNNLSKKISNNGYLWMDENLNFIKVTKKLSHFLSQV